MKIVVFSMLKVIDLSLLMDLSIVHFSVACIQNISIKSLIFAVEKFNKPKYLNICKWRTALPKTFFVLTFFTIP